MSTPESGWERARHESPSADSGNSEAAAQGENEGIMKDLNSLRVRVVANAVFIEHIGHSGDIAVFSVGTKEFAQDVADELNAIFNGFRAALADAARKAGEFAHASNEREQKLLALLDRAWAQNERLIDTKVKEILKS